MFDTSQVEELPVAGIPGDADCFDPACLDDEAAGLNAASEPPVAAQSPVSECAPSGWLVLELDQGCADPAALSENELIDAVIGFDRLASWALARQAVLLAEFARRRPEDHPLAANLDTPSRCSEFAPDEVVAPSWEVDQQLDDRITWTTPTGHTYTSDPHDYRPDSHPPPDDDPPPF